MRHQRQVVGQQQVEVTGCQLADRRNARFPEHGDLVDVERRLADPQAEVVVVQLRTAGAPPRAVPALVAHHRTQQRWVRDRCGACSLGELHARGELEGVAVEGTDQAVLGLLGRGRRDDRLGEVEPDRAEALVDDIVAADDAGQRSADSLLAGGGEQVPQVGELQGVAGAPVPAVPPPRGRVALGQRCDRGEGCLHLALRASSTRWYFTRPGK